MKRLTFCLFFLFACDGGDELLEELPDAGLVELDAAAVRPDARPPELPDAAELEPDAHHCGGHGQECCANDVDPPGCFDPEYVCNHDAICVPR